MKKHAVTAAQSPDWCGDPKECLRPNLPAKQCFAARPWRFPHRPFLRPGMTALILAALLCGCAQEAPSPEFSSPETAEVLSATVSPSEEEPSARSAVRSYSLAMTDARGMVSLDHGLLVFSGEETILTLLEGEALTVRASAALGFPLSHQDPSLQLHGSTLSYFDPVAQETVVLDSSLHPVTHIPAPAGLSGTPLLSRDRNTLYYCTSTALMAWDRESDIRRTVKEMAFPGQSVTGLHASDTVIRCMAESDLFLDAQTGRLIKDWDAGIQLTSRGNDFYAAFPMGFETGLVFGNGQDTRILLPAAMGDSFFLPRNHALVSGCQEEDTGLQLDIYDLASGRRESRLTMNSGAFPMAITGDGQFVYILMEGPEGDTIYRWDPSQMPINDGQDYTETYVPDPQASVLTACRSYAQKLSAKYGITILIGKEAAAQQPWDYDLEAETQPAILQKELEQLDHRLSRFPAGMLAQTAGNFSSLNLCLVRSVTGSAESGSTGSAAGAQFLEGSDAYVAIAVGRYGEHALYHELFHAMETHIFTHSIAFDQWDTLNPAGFRYDYSYSANAQRDSGVYLDKDSRAFIDTYSMSFPKEDRARIFEYASLPGYGPLFQSQAMQEKLRCLCSGLREAYGLEDSPEAFPWEQYLD